MSTRDTGAAGVVVDKPRRRVDGRLVREKAVEIFFSRGFDGTSVQSIASELGILKGSLYHHIDGKEDLLFDLVSVVHRDLQLVMDLPLPEDDLDPLDQLYCYVRRHVEYATGHGREVTIYYRDFGHLSAEHQDQLRVERSSRAHFIAGIIAEAQRRGDIVQDAPARVLTNLVFGAFIGTFRWYQPGQSPDASEFAKMCADYAVRAVGGRASAYVRELW